jgi:hypothetical protein
VEISLFGPLLGIPVKTWEGEADNNSDAGTVSWDIPSWVPGGFEMTVSGFHEDQGVLCEGTIVVKLEGDFGDGPFGYVALAATVIALGTRRGRPVIGAIAGFVFGLAIAADLLFIGTLALDSILLLVLPLAFLVIGLVIGLFPPLGFLRRGERRASSAPPATGGTP